MSKELRELPEHLTYIIPRQQVIETINKLINKVEELELEIKNLNQQDNEYK